VNLTKSALNQIRHLGFPYGLVVEPTPLKNMKVLFTIYEKMFQTTNQLTTRRLEKFKVIELMSSVQIDMHTLLPAQSTKH
jgi:hypothetical protein